MAGVNTGRFNAVLKYECLNDFERDSVPFEVVPYISSLCTVDGMYGDDINGTTRTVGFRAMTALKRDGSALIPASLVNVLKGT